MIVSVQLHYAAAADPSGVRLARRVAEQLSEHIDDDAMPDAEHVKRVVAWVGEPIADTSLIPTIQHPRSAKS